MLPLAYPPVDQGATERRNDGITEWALVRLFADRARAAAPSSALTNDNAQAVAEICRQLDGIPLAIELAAARVRVLTVEQIAERLEDRFSLLAVGSRTAPPRHQTLRALIDWSYDLLSEPEQTLLRRLSVFAGGFDLSAAEAVCGDPTLETYPDILALLGSLVEKSLVVTETPVGGEARYHLLWTIREYARERLATPGEADLAAERHAAYYLARAEESASSDFTSRQGVGFARLDVEQGNLRQALDWFEECDLERAFQLVAALGIYWWRYGRATEARRRFTVLLPRRHGFPRAVALARFLLAAASFVDDQATHHKLLEESLSVSRGVGNRRVAALALRYLAREAQSKGDYPAARSLFAECLTEADSELRPEILVDDAFLAQRVGDYARARTQFEVALDLCRQGNVPESTAHAADHLGKLERLQGNLARAEALSEESLALFREAGDQICVVWMFRAFGHLARLQGNFARAHGLQQEALAGARAMALGQLEAEALDELSLLAAAEGDFTGARRQLGEALSLMREHPERRWGSRWQVAEITASLGLVARAEGNLREARRLFAETLAIWREFDNRHGVAAVQGNLGVVALQEGDLAGARALFAESLVVRRELGDQGGIAMLLECFAGLASLADEPRRAFQLLGAADAIREAIGNPAPPVWRGQRDPWLEPARQALDTATQLHAYVTGQTMGLEQAIADTAARLREE